MQLSYQWMLGVIIVYEPGFVVAVGGIPDHLKIKSARAISFGHRFPISKLPADLPVDLTQRRRVFFKALKESRSQFMPVKTCWACNQLLPEESVIVYFNAIPPLPSDVNDAIAPAPIPSQSMEESEEDDSSYWYPLNRDIVTRQPRFVGVVGGIPQYMRIKDGISFWLPSPKFKYPKVMPADYTERQHALSECYYNGMRSHAFVNAFLQAYMKAKSKAQGLSSSSICHNIDQQPPTTPMIEFNLAATPGTNYLPFNDRWQAVKFFILVESPSGCTFLRRDFSDSRELAPLVGVVINEPGIVAAVGGIPNELKIEGAKTFWFRCPALKYSHIEVEDYEDDMDANGDDVDDVDANEDGVDDVDANEYMDDMDKVYNSGDDMAAIEVEYIKIFREDVIRAYREVYRVSSSSSSTCKQEADAHSIDPLCPMAEVNILESQFGSAFDELNKDNNVET